MRIILLVCLVLISALGKAQTRKSKDKIEYIKSYDYRIIIDITAPFWRTESKYILDNRKMGFYDTLFGKNDMLKPLTLYYISFSKKIDPNNSNAEIIVPFDTTEIDFSEDNSDKLFDLTRVFFQKINFCCIKRNNYLGIRIIWVYLF